MAEIPINYLKYIDQDGTEKKVYPITVTDAVYDSDGNKLSNVLLGVLKDTDISNVQSDSTTTVPSSALLKATDDKIGDTSSLPGESSNVVSAITQLNSDIHMDGIKVYTNISELGLTGAETPSNIINYIPEKTIIIVANTNFTSNEWNFPHNYGTLVIYNIISGRAVAYLYGKTESNGDYRMFALDNSNLSGVWNKITYS